MIASFLRIASLVTTTIVVASFAMFVVDQGSAGSQTQVARVASGDGGTAAGAPSQSLDVPNPSAAVKAERARRHGRLRELIDEGDDVLIGPFAGIVKSSSIWVERLVPTLIGLLIFTFGLRLLANYSVGLGSKRPAAAAGR